MSDRARKPRVLFVLPATVRGGAEIRLQAMLGAFTRITPILLAHRSLAGIGDVAVEQLHFEDFPGCHDPYPYDWRNILTYARAVREAGRRVRPDLTFGWMHNGSFFVAGASLLGLAGKRAGCILGPPTDHFKLAGRTATPYERFLFAAACRRLHRVITPSHGVSDDLCAHFKVPASRLQTVYNGIDFARVARLAAQPLPAGVPPKRRPWIVSAARLSPEKGMDVLVRAFARVRARVDADLVIVGEGPHRGCIETLSQDLGVAANVILTGYMDNPFPWMLRADVFAMASRLEGFGNALVEAMSLGVPVVAAACPWGPREILAQPSSGMLVPVDDVDALAQALIEVLTNPAQAADLRQGGQQAAQRFSFDAMMQGYEAHITALLPADAA